MFVALSTWLQPILHNDHISSARGWRDARGDARRRDSRLCRGSARGRPRPAERRYLPTAVVWVFTCCLGLAVLHPYVAADFVLIAAIGFVLLAALPVMLELTERRMGASGGVATGILLLVGNAGGLLVAIIVGALVDLPAAAFIVLAIVVLLGLPAARRVVDLPPPAK